jgi:prepilin peptidase CpaA
MNTDQFLLTAPLLLILGVATLMDWRQCRIPNVLSFGAALFGLVLQGTVNGAEGLLSGVGGWLVCFLFFLPFYAKGGMAAGDVKLMAAVGTFLGPFLGFFACIFSLTAGGLIGVASIAIAWSSSHLASSAGDNDFALRNALRTRIPYAGAIAAGTSITLLFPSLIPAALF